MRVQLLNTLEDIASLENLLAAWQEFVRGKRQKPDVQIFARHLLDNLVGLHEELTTGTYCHGGYRTFSIADPKPRRIHKASVRDRVLHHAIHRVLYPFFDRTFIVDSYSCRLGKGAHKPLNRLRAFAYRVSQNHTRTCWILKFDIVQFFASIDHDILRYVLERYLPDRRILWLLQQVIGSFSSTRSAVGLPLGNLTSQLLVNVYMNEFDQFVKHHLKARYFIRYADDFVIVSHDRPRLERLIGPIERFLWSRLRLRVHADKVTICTLASGVDFLGWVHFPHHRVLRTATKRRMFRRVQAHPVPTTLQSYLGLLGHGNTILLRGQLASDYWLWVVRGEM